MITDPPQTSSTTLSNFFKGWFFFHMTHDKWQMTHSAGWTFSQKFSSLALTVGNWQCLVDIWNKGSVSSQTYLITLLGGVFIVYHIDILIYESSKGLGYVTTCLKQYTRGNNLPCAQTCKVSFFLHNQIFRLKMFTPKSA